MGSLAPFLRTSSGPIKERLTISERRAQAEQTLKRMQEALEAEELSRNKCNGRTPSVPQPTSSGSVEPNDTGRRSSDDSSAGSSTMHSGHLTYRSEYRSECGTQPPSIAPVSAARSGKRSTFSTELHSLSESQCSNDEAESEDTGSAANPDAFPPSLSMSSSASELTPRVCLEQNLHTTTVAHPSAMDANPCSPQQERPVLRKASSASAMLSARPAAYAALAFQGHSRTTAALDPAITFVMPSAA